MLSTVVSFSLMSSAQPSLALFIVTCVDLAKRGLGRVDLTPGNGAVGSYTLPRWVLECPGWYV
jgi:hypothetical protein